MKSRAIIPLAVGLAVGVFAIKVFTDVLQKAKGASKTDDVTVVCATRDIAPAMEITETMIEVKQVPRAGAPQMAFTEAQEVLGRVASLTIPRGMAVVPTLLAPKGTPPGMAVRIKDGYRAVAVKVDEFAGVAGWIKPGSRVDVVAVMQTTGASGRQRGTISKVILDNIEVLAVGQDLGSAGDMGASVVKSVTLLVRPEDVPKLHLAGTKGTIKLAMRNQRDYSISGKAQTTDKELFDGAPGSGSSNSHTPKAMKSSILSRLFRTEPKTEPDATDKTREAPEEPEPVAVAVVPQKKQPWCVELLEGQQMEEVWFSDDGRRARRLEGKPETVDENEPAREVSEKVRAVPRPHRAKVRKAVESARRQLTMESSE